MIEGHLVRLRPLRPTGFAAGPSGQGWGATPRVARRFAQDSGDESFAEDEPGVDRPWELLRLAAAGIFAIERRDRPEVPPVGRIAFERLEMQARSAEVHLSIDDPIGWTQGMGADALMVLVRYLFRDRNLHRVAHTALSSNPRAIRAFETVGFVFEGTLRDDVYAHGRYHDRVVMSILRDEFDERFPTDGNGQ